MTLNWLSLRQDKLPPSPNLYEWACEKTQRSLTKFSGISGFSISIAMDRCPVNKFTPLFSFEVCLFLCEMTHPSSKKSKDRLQPRFWGTRHLIRPSFCLFAAQTIGLILRLGFATGSPKIIYQPIIRGKGFKGWGH